MTHGADQTEFHSKPRLESQALETCDETLPLGEVRLADGHFGTALRSHRDLPQTPDRPAESPIA